MGIDIDRTVPSYVIGGLGSDQECLDQTCHDLSGEFPAGIAGLTYPQLRQQSEHFWRNLAPGANILAYSGSTPYVTHKSMCARALPASVTLIAATNEVSRYAALRGFVLASLEREDVKEIQAAQTANESLRLLGRFAHEVGSHAIEYRQLIHHSRRFAQLAAAVALHETGIAAVNIVALRGDPMFSAYVIPSTEARYGVRYVAIPGGHTRFSADPLGTLELAETTPATVVNADILANTIPDLLEKPPTLRSTARGLARRAIHRMPVNEPPVHVAA